MARILFITSTRIGDAVLSSGLLDHLVSHNPDARITVACGPLAAPLFRAAPGVGEIIVMAKRAGGGHWIDLWRRTVMRRWDLVVDLRRSAMSRMVWTAKRAVKRRPAEDAVLHKVVEAGRVLALNTPPAPVLWLDQAARERAEALFPQTGFLALAPAAAAPFKEWAPDRFSELARHLTGSDGALAGMNVVLLGGPGDEAKSRAAAEGIDPERLIDLTGQLSIVEAGAVLERARLFVGNDSGLMHIAAASGAPTLGLFGPTDERVYGPWGARTRAVRAGGPADESERGRLRLAEDSLMGDLPVDVVRQAANELLERN
ncbi:MAG: glycosyltransferase family 9 protein [Pseudomonadota bacterium]